MVVGGQGRAAFELRNKCYFLGFARFVARKRSTYTPPPVVIVAFGHFELTTPAAGI